MNQPRALVLTLSLALASACTSDQGPLSVGDASTASGSSGGTPMRGGGDPASGGGLGGVAGGGTPGAGGMASGAGGAAGGGTIGSGGAGGAGRGGASGSGGAAGSGSGASAVDAATGPCAPAACQGQPVPAIGCVAGAPRFDCVRANDGSCRWSPPMCPSAPTPDAGRGDAGIGGGPCATDSDCRLYDDYCTGCDCRSLAKSDPEPKCAGPGVRCLVQPCGTKVAACVAGRCALKDKTTAALKWWKTCGDPVCRGYTGGSGAPRCATEKAGDACATADQKCDPMDSCNALLVCGATDPTKGGVVCPISRRDAKQDIAYLPPEALIELRDELLSVPLATWRYKHDPAAAHLGFIIEDLKSGSPAVDAQRGLVDLYGYTSMAVATLQLQAREIATLRAEVEQLKRQARRRAR